MSHGLVKEFKPADLVAARAVIEAFIHDRDSLDIVHQTVIPTWHTEKPGAEPKLTNIQGPLPEQMKQVLQYISNDLSARLGDMQLIMLDDNKPKRG